MRVSQASFCGPIWRYIKGAIEDKEEEKDCLVGVVVRLILGAVKKKIRVRSSKCSEKFQG